MTPEEQYAVFRVTVVFWLVVWVLIWGILGAYVANACRRSVREGFWLAALFGPLGVIIVALLPKGGPAADREQPPPTASAGRRPLAQRYVRVQCTNCHRSLKAPESHAGRIESCPACGANVSIPIFSSPAPLSTSVSTAIQQRQTLETATSDVPDVSQSAVAKKRRRDRRFAILFATICTLVGAISILAMRDAGPVAEQRFNKAPSILERERAALKAAEEKSEQIKKDNEVALCRWKSHSGSLDVDAKIVNVKGNVITLERADGGQIQVVPDYLTDEGQAAVREWVADHPNN